MLKKIKVRLEAAEVLFLILALVFSSWLMFSTFASKSGLLLIDSKLWSDFSFTIPVIRSFSFGYNFPPEFPLFSGYNIRYHFVFFAIVGFLERIGVPLGLALNSLSTLGFFLLMVAIYFMAKNIFKSRKVGFLSVIFFIFNGSFSFLEFFKLHPLSGNTFNDIIKNTSFPSFGPYDGKVVSAFWNLNIFTNQRHLAFSYACFLGLIFLIHKLSKKPNILTYKLALLVGLAIGLFPFIHYAVFGMMIIFLGLAFLIYPKIRLKIIAIGTFSLLLAIPQILYMGKSEVAVSLFHPGYLMGRLSTSEFVRYWFMNLGLSFIFAPLGFLLSDKDQRKLFLTFIPFFIIGNLFQFSPEIAANHKFFNLFLIGMNMFMAYAIIRLWKINIASRILITIIFPIIIFSGIIDLFPIANDSVITIQDVPKNQAATFIKEATPKDATFLNSSYLYNSASLAGRKIYIGWPYFAWSAGYDTDLRGKMFREFYTLKDKTFICDFLKREDLDYFTAENTFGNRDLPEIDLDFFNNNFKSVYKEGDFAIFETKSNCNL